MRTYKSFVYPVSYKCVFLTYNVYVQVQWIQKKTIEKKKQHQQQEAARQGQMLALKQQQQQQTAVMMALIERLLPTKS